MEYKIIQGCELAHLVEEVGTHIASGWHPHGSPFLYAASVCQAMTREAELPRIKIHSEQLGEMSEMLKELLRQTTYISAQP